MTIVALVASALLAGCMSGPSDPQGNEVDEHMRTCSIFLNRPVANDTYVLPLDPDAWVENASLYAALLAERGNDTSVHDLHAPCDEPHEAEIEWMASQYWETPGARTTGRYYYFSVPHWNVTHTLQIEAAWHDLPTWPTRPP